MQNKYMFVLSIIDLDDTSEKVYTYRVCATSEKQARFFLGQHLGCYFTESFRNGFAMKHKTNRNVFVIVDKYIQKATTEFIGEIILL